MLHKHRRNGVFFLNKNNNNNNKGIVKMAKSK